MIQTHTMAMVLITQPLSSPRSRDEINTFYFLHIYTRGGGDFQILFQSIDHMIGPTAK